MDVGSMTVYVIVRGANYWHRHHLNSYLLNIKKLNNVEMVVKLL